MQKGTYKYPLIFILSLFSIGCSDRVFGSSYKSFVDSTHLDKKLNIVDAVHFLNRTGFGAELNALEALIGKTRRNAITEVIQNIKKVSQTPPPLWVTSRAPPHWGKNDLPPKERNHFVTSRTNEFENLQLWWAREIAQTTSPLTERLVLFWTNHFVSAFSGVDYWARAMARQHFNLRKVAATSFDRILLGSLQEPAILNYLDNDRNRKGKPNENLGRELLELFTLGEGNYTEKDVIEASRALTGWRVSRHKNLSFWEDKWAHDRGRKEIFGKIGNHTTRNLIDLILEHPETKNFITKKFWGYFVSETYFPQDTLNHIAQKFYKSKYDVKVLLKNILESREFWSPKVRGTIVKSPIDFVFGTIRALQLSPSNFDKYPVILKNMGQELFNPPNVGGWPKGRSWVTPSSMIERAKFVEEIISEKNIIKSNRKINKLHRFLINKHSQSESNSKKFEKKKKIIRKKVLGFHADTALLSGRGRSLTGRRKPKIRIGFINATVGNTFWYTLGVEFIVDQLGFRIRFRNDLCDPFCFSNKSQSLSFFFSDDFNKIQRKFRNLNDDERLMVASIAGSLGEIGELIAKGHYYQRHRYLDDWVQLLRKKHIEFKKKKWVSSLIIKNTHFQVEHGYYPEQSRVQNNMMMGRDSIPMGIGIVPCGKKPLSSFKELKSKVSRITSSNSLAFYFSSVPDEFANEENSLQKTLSHPAFNVR